MSFSDSRQNRAADERKQYVEREEILAEIREHYARFGERVVLAILSYATRTNGLRELVAKLPLRNSAWTESQLHDVIARFIVNEGVSRFLDLLSRDKAASLTPIPEKPAPSPAVPTCEEPAGEEAGEKDLIWTDRRSGEDRRSGKDRRDNVEMIFKNKRYGGDRRNGEDRRKRQIPPPWPKG